MSNYSQQMSERMNIVFALTSLSDIALNCRLAPVQNWQAAGTFDEFVIAVRPEFVPLDHIRRARDKLRRPTQKTSVPAYRNGSRSISLTLPEMSADDKWGKFV